METKEVYNRLKSNLLLMRDKSLSFFVLNYKKYGITFCSRVSDFFFNNKELIIKTLLPIVIILFGFYSCSDVSKKVKRDMDNLFLITDDIRLYFSNKADYWGLDTAFVTNNKIIDNKFIKGQNIFLDLDKQILIGRGNKADTIMPRSDNFDIVLNNLNMAQCIAYLEADITPQNQMKLLAITLTNNRGDFVFEWGNKNYSLPITKNIGKDICYNKENTIIWTVK